MAGRTFMRSILLSEPWGRPCHRLSPLSSFSPFFSSRHRFNLTHFHSSSPLRCSNGEYPPPSSSSSSQQEGDQGPPQEAILKAISEVSKSEGRVAQTTNVIIGGTVTDDATNRWLQLDQKVNSYPMVRGFTAIGTGGDDFVHAMVDAVESVLQQPIPKGQVTQRLSSKGKYVSVNIGPICVVSSEQVQAVYSAMRRDDRMKYFL